MSEVAHDAALDLTRRFLPEALAGLDTVRGLSPSDHLRLNQIRAFSYLHLFDLFEGVLSTVSRARARYDVDTHDTLVPLLGHDAFDHHALFGVFEAALSRAFPAHVRALPPPDGFVRTLEHASPLALLVFALHLKYLTQQHYLACVRGDEELEPHFVKLLKEHWEKECGAGKPGGPTLALQQALGAALPGRIPAALRDYRLVVFACDEVLRAQTDLDLATLEQARAEPLAAGARTAVAAALYEASRNTFLVVGIVNAAFVYAMRALGPTAPSALAGIVSALGARRS